MFENEFEKDQKKITHSFDELSQKRKKNLQNLKQTL